MSEMFQPRIVIASEPKAPEPPERTREVVSEPEFQKEKAPLLTSNFAPASPAPSPVESNPRIPVATDTAESVMALRNEAAVKREVVRRHNSKPVLAHVVRSVLR